VGLRFKGSITVRAINREVKSRIRKASGNIGVSLVTQMKDKVGIQGPPRSEPGEPPRKDTGELFKSIDWSFETSTMTLIVGSTSDHAVFTEFGLTYPERPWFRDTIVENLDSMGLEYVTAF